MNYFTNNISQRISRNDPTITEVSIRRFPLVSISSTEVATIVKSLRYNTIVKAVDISIPLSVSSRSSSSSSSNRQPLYSYYDNDDTDISCVESNENVAPITTTNNRNSRNGCPSLSSSSYEYLYDLLSTNIVIVSLTLRDMKCDEVWIAVAAGIKHNTTIRTLTLGSNNNVNNTDLSPIACQALRDILIHGKTLECVQLKSFSFPNYTDCVDEICIGFKGSTSLREIQFHSIENLNIVRILTALAKSSSTLTKLTVTDCDIQLNVQEDFEEENAYDQQHPLNTILSDPSSILSRTLKEVRINECMIHGTDFKILCHAVQRNTSIEVFDLSCCDLLGSDMSHAIAQLLRHNQSLLHLLLQDNLFGDRDVQVMAQCGLQSNTTLQTLDVKANRITEIGCQYIAEAIRGGGGVNNTSTSAATFGCPLQTLTLSDNAITDMGAKYIGQALANNDTIRTLDLDGCRITDNGIVRLCEGLVLNSSLKEMNLSNNWCKDRGGRSISDMLSTNETLQTLDVSSCHISNETIERLLQSLTMGTNTSLKSLYISFNSFTNQGAQAIATMLSGSNQLQCISAQCNHFDSNGLRMIVDALTTNYYLKNFYFWNGHISAHDDKHLIDELDHYLNLNRAGRRAIHRNDDNRTNNEIWAAILHHADEVYGPTAIFDFLREKPTLLTSNKKEDVSSIAAV